MNSYKTIGIFFAWLLAGLVQTLILYQFIDVKVSVLLVHSLWRAMLFFGLNLLLKFVIVFGKFAVLPKLQRWINYSFVVILTVSIWLGVGLLGDFLFFGKNITAIFSELLPVYITFALMTAVIIIQMIIIQINSFSTEDTHEEVPRSENEKNEGELLERIAVRSNSKIHVIPANDIYFLSSDGDYVLIHTENAKYLKEQTMKYFQNHLPTNFLRVHRSHIINCDKISRIELLEKQTYYLILKNGQKLKMSVTGYKLLREKLSL
jgi:signal transduction histidine kinase